MPALLSGLAAGFALAIPLGAIAVLIVLLSARHGWRVGVPAGLGAATVDGVYATVAALAGALIAPWLAGIETPMRWISAVVLLGIAALLLGPLWRRNARGADAEDDAEAAVARDRSRLSGWAAFAMLFGLTATNPATVVYFAALVAGSGGGSGVLATPADHILWVLGVVVASALWQSLLAILGARLSRWVTSPRGRVWTAVIGATLIVGLAVKTALGW